MESTFAEIGALQDLLGVDKEEEQHIFGSAINPGTLNGKDAENKEIAPPNAKIEVKTFNRGAQGGATVDDLRKA